MQSLRQNRQLVLTKQRFVQMGRDRLVGAGGEAIRKQVHPPEGNLTGQSSQGFTLSLPFLSCARAHAGTASKRSPDMACVRACVH
eukprot:1152060-Pelagomonas_calceolata.AAC.7